MISVKIDNKQLERNIESLRVVPLEKIKAELVLIEQSLAILSGASILIVSIIEYKKLSLSRYILKEAIERGCYELHGKMPTKKERPTFRALPGGSPSGGPSTSRKNRRMPLVCV